MNWWTEFLHDVALVVLVVAGIVLVAVIVWTLHYVMYDTAIVQGTR